MLISPLITEIAGAIMAEMGQIWQNHQKWPKIK